MATMEVLSGGSERDPWSNKRRVITAIGVAALLSAAGGTIYQHDRSQAFLTSEEQQAQASIQEVFTTMETGDIIGCRVAGPPIAKAIEWPFIGPVVDKRTNIPSLSVNVMVEPGDLDESKEVRNVTGRYNAAITWQSLQLQSRIQFIQPYEEIDTAQNAKPSKVIELQNITYNYILPFKQTENLHVNIPIYSKFNGTALVDIVPVVGNLELTETTHGELEIAPTSFKRELVGKPCVSLLVAIHGKRIRHVDVLRYE